MMDLNMTLDYNENYRWIAPRLNTHIACAWGHIINNNPEAFLRYFLLYCSQGGNFINTKSGATEKRIIKLVRYYSGNLDEVDMIASPFDEKDWRHWAFQLIFESLNEYYNGKFKESEDDVSSVNMEMYTNCKKKFKELGVI